MATVYQGGASIDEHGKARGGDAGDQTGREVKVGAWYKHSLGWVVIRAKSALHRAALAAAMRAACANPNIGYDQSQRDTLYNAAKPLGFDPGRVKVKCETDCSALVRVCCNYAGIPVGNFRTINEPATLRATGRFDILTDPKYTDHPDYLLEGDILCTKVSGHTVIVLSDGDLAHGVTMYGPINPDKVLTLKKGYPICDAVAYMQSLLVKKGYRLPRSVKRGSKYGYDGEWGDETERVFRQYQEDHNDLHGNDLVVDGECGPLSWGSLLGVPCKG